MTILKIKTLFLINYLINEAEKTYMELNKEQEWIDGHVTR